MTRKVKSDFINLLLENWQEARKLTIDWVNLIPTKSLNEKLPRIGLNTFAKQVLEMADVQEAYTKALDGKHLNFSKVTDGTDIKKVITKSELKERLTSSEDLFRITASSIKNWDKLIQVFGEKLPKYSVLELMTRHETLHHGQFIAYGYLMKLTFPGSWVRVWAIPTKK